MEEAVFSVRWSMRRLYNASPLVVSANSVKYLSVIFDKNITWRPHTEMMEAKAFRTFIRVYSLVKNARLSTDIKLTLHKALIRSVMTYACSA
jgi:hypothetical protein